MSIFDKIKNALFTRHAKVDTMSATVPATAPVPAAATSMPAPTQAATPSAVSAPTTPVAQPAPTAAPAVAAPAAPATPHPAAASVDVAAIMDAAVKESGQKLNWRTSIVDTMKALGLDSDLTSRKELAQELHYTGDTNDSGAMNVWLQKALMKKLSENGGKVPAELMD
jgi:hypothetical protein